MLLGIMKAKWMTSKDLERHTLIVPETGTLPTCCPQRRVCCTGSFWECFIFSEGKFYLAEALDLFPFLRKGLCKRRRQAWFFLQVSHLGGFWVGENYQITDKHTWFVELKMVTGSVSLVMEAEKTWSNFILCMALFNQVKNFSIHIDTSLIF